MNHQPCPSCAEASRNPAHGGYRMTCLGCCARLLATTRPRSQQAAAMLAVIERAIKRHQTAFGPDAVKACASQIRAKRRCLRQKSITPGEAV